MEKRNALYKIGIVVAISLLVLLKADRGVAATASYQPSSYQMRDSFSKSPKDASISLNAINGLTVDPFTGAANLTFPLSLPPGRNGMQPPLNLSYSTSYPNGPMGVGWRFDLGYVERSTKNGIPSYSQSDKYVFFLNGFYSELIYANNVYYPEIGPENLKFAFDGSCWKARDKQGRIYYFGDQTMPGSFEKKSPSETFRWYLVKIEDLQGNYMRIEYAAGANCSTLSKIYYTLNPAMGTAYSRYSVEFFYEATERSDRYSLFRTGYYLNMPPGRLSAIKAWLEEPAKKTLVKKYAFEYKYSNFTNRSLLTKITEYGSDERTSLPPVTFTYQEAEPAYTVTALTDPSDMFADVNGDGFADLIEFNKEEKVIKVRLSDKGRGFAPATEWSRDFANGYILMGDFNGDGRVDICVCNPEISALTVALSDGRKFVNSGVWNSKIDQSGHYRSVPFVADVNGDGLSDIVVPVNRLLDCYMNTGSSFEYRKTGDQFVSSVHGAFGGDFDGDGLSDIMAFNINMASWTVMPVAETSIRKNGTDSLLSSSRQMPQGVDVNSDGITDAIYYDFTKGKIQRKIFNGKSFKNIADAPFIFSMRDQDTSFQSADFNGDGLADYAACFDGKIEIAYSQGNFTDILVKVDNGIGATTEFFYKPSSSYANKRSDGTSGLPFAIPVFYQNKISDGRGNSYITTYYYMSGLYDSQEKEFAGFGFCRITDQDGNYTEKFFRQDKDLRGKIYRENVKDKNRNIFASAESVWEKKELYPGVNLIYLKQREEIAYSGNDEPKQKRVNFEYDDYGNPVRIIYSGDISLTGDEKTEVFEYNYNSINNIVSLPCRSYALDALGVRIQEKRFYYDMSGSYTAAPVKGLLTREEAWLYNPLDSSQNWVTTNYKYDTFGNLIETADPLNHISKIEYDGVLKTFPVKTANALNQNIITTYNYILGKPLTTTDANSQVTTYQYDPLGRVTAVIGPNDNAQYPGSTYAYNQTARPSLVTTQKRVQPLAAAVYTSYQFFDGLGRLIQTKTPVASNKYIISDIVKFDAQGRKKEAYLPYYVTTASAAYSTPDYSQPKTAFEYDCLGRIIKTTRPNGTYAQNIYSGWSVIGIDENGHQTKNVLDAYGRTVKVCEYNNNQVYTTSYEYNALGNLSCIIDDQDNKTIFSYDSLGRKLRVNDPDMGIWDYEYDLAGNLIKQTDAKGQELDFEYDELNRIRKKKAVTSRQGTITITATLAFYFYDEAKKPYCIGRLSKVIGNFDTSEYFYDKLGRKTREIKTIDSASYATEYTYDSLDRALTLKYPDNTVIKYDYTIQGITKAANITSPSSPVNYLSSAEYSATNQNTKNIFGNNAVTNYTYDPKTLRLTKLVTQNSLKKLQDLQYSFDNVGNITHIQDNLNTANQDFIYDDLNRLTQASGSYGVFTYGYDSTGNMLNKEGASFVYGQGNLRPHALRYASDGSQFSYDDNGNLTQEYAPARGKVNYYYDLENHLTKIEPKDQNRQELTFTLRLSSGWNTFSLPIIPKDSNILRVLKDLSPGTDYDQVARYNAVSKTWEMFTNQPEFDQFSTIEYGRGYEIFVTNPAGATLNVQGYFSSTESEFPVSAGWNLVCYPYAASSMSVESGFWPLGLGTDYDTVEQYNSAAGSIQKYTAAQKQFSDLKRGSAYYVRALKSTRWKVPAQNSASLSLAGAVEQNEFVYDYAGERIKKVTARGTTVYVGDIYEKSSDGTIRKHIFSGATRIASILTPSPGGGGMGVGEIIYYHPDHLGSSNVVSDKSGNQARLSEYTPFGSFAKNNVTASAGSSVGKQSHYFTGKELDTSGLYHYGARYYHPLIAHFTQPDPLIQDPYDPQTLNHYAYCRNNPLFYTDPTGMSLFGPSWGSLGSWWGSFWGGMGSMFSFGISTIGRWGMQMNSFMYSQANAVGDFFGSTFNMGMRGLSDYFQFQWDAQSLFGNALGMGMKYGASLWGQGLTELGRSYRDVFTKATTYGIDLFDNGKIPKLQIGYELIGTTPAIHTYLKITGMSGYNGRWDFNPRDGFSSSVLLGDTVPGKVFSSDVGRSFPLITISKDPTIIKQVYNIAMQQAKNPISPNYILYGLTTYNCFTWRNEILNKAGFSEQWGGE